MRRMILAGLIGTIAAVGMSALPATAAQARPQEDRFNEWLTGLSNAAAADPKYNRIPLDTDAQQREFMELTRQLYDRKITVDQYRQILLTQYPGHDYEVGFIIAKLP